MINATIGGEISDMRTSTPDTTMEFSEAAFSFAVTHGLVNLRTGGFGLQRVRIASKRISGHSSSELNSRLIAIERILKKRKMNPHEARAIVYPYKSPYIPTQFSEKEFPVDLAMNVRGVHCFLQFKRSVPVLKIHWNHKESGIVDKAIHLPLYRVYIHGGKHGKDQWKELKKLQDDLKPENAAVVRYVAPAFHTLAELSQFHNDGFFSRIERRKPVMCFKPGDFTLPGNGSHWISFDGRTRKGFRYPSKPIETLDVCPLVELVGKRSHQAPALKDSIEPLRKSLDKIADDRKLGDLPRNLENRAILDTLGIPRFSEEDKPGPPDVVTLARASGTFNDQQSKWSDYGEAELAGTIQNITNDGEFGMVKSLLSFATNYCVADYRSRQILGQPLMVYANPESELYPDGDTS